MRGVAITTAAAKLVDNLRGKPKRTIRVVMWGAEEVGLFGGKAYAAQHADELDRHVLAAESDFGAGEIYRFDSRFGEGAIAKAAPMAVALRGLGVAPGATNRGGGPDVGADPRSRRAGCQPAPKWLGLFLIFTTRLTIRSTKLTLRRYARMSPHGAAFLYMASEMDGDFGRLPPKEAAE